MTITAKIDGKVARPGELKTSASGKEFCNLVVSVYYAKDQKTEYINATFFGEQGVYASKLEKGAPVSILGDLRLNEYTALDGTVKQNLSVTVNKFINL